MAQYRADVMEEGLFCFDWTAKEELNLLDSIDEYGYGNWSSIAVRVGKRAEDCKTHYNHYYLQHPHPSLPVLHPCCEEGSCHPQRRSDHGTPAYYPGTEIEGYMPHRGDFAVEADDEAEEEIAGLTLDPEDDELLTALKLTAAKIYCWKLRRRAYRKRVIRDYGLLDIRRQLATDEAKLTKKQLRIKQMFRPFMRFMHPETAEKFLQSHFLEAKLCEEIKKLQDYRDNGITTLKGSELHQRLLAQRRQSRQVERESVRRACATEESLFYQVLLKRNMVFDIPKKPNTGTKDRPVLDISHCVGVEKLTPEERELCSQCRLQPESYLHYKQQLVSEWERQGKLRLADARKQLKIDVNKTRKIYNFLLEKGLISQ